MKIKHLIKYLAIAIIGILPQDGLAASKAATNPYMDWIMQNIILVLGSVVILWAAIALWNLAMMLIEHNSNEALRAQGIEPKRKVDPNAPSLWSKLFDKATSLVPIDMESDIDLGHDYDGIRELDNSLPPWWLYGFYVSIIVAIGYLYVYQFSDLGNNQLEEYEIAMQVAEDQKAAYAARQSNAIDEKNLEVLTDASALEIGERVYLSNCAACHGQQGQGGVGPNLTDDYWIHGGHIKKVYRTIKNGVPEKGMIAWKAQLQPKTIIKVASFIKTLHDTNPPNPKRKEGEFYKESTTLETEEK